MMLLYGLVRCIASALHKKSQRAHDRAKAVYERLQEVFKGIETDCKADEVTVGRPTGLSSQIRLLKAYESAEDARQKWVRSTNKLQKRTKLAEKVNGFQTARLPYTFGLLDMTVVLRAIEHFGLPPEFTMSHLFDSVSNWLS